MPELPRLADRPYLCTARCDAQVLHQRALATYVGQPALSLTCTGCGAESLLLWVTHHEVEPGRTACGLAQGVRVLASPRFDDVECLACLLIGPTEAWTWGLQPARLNCTGACRKAQVHERWVGLLDGEPHLRTRCQACGLVRVTDQVAHLPTEQRREAACGARLPRHGPARRALDEVTCLPCLERLRDTVSCPEPDWRPESPIAEDYYAG